MMNDKKNAVNYWEHSDFKQVEAPGFLRTYCSVVEMVLNNYELQVVFGEYNTIPSEPEFIKKVTVSMAPEHAKRFHAFLGRKIARWEKEFGAEYRKSLDQGVFPDPD